MLHSVKSWAWSSIKQPGAGFLLVALLPLALAAKPALAQTFTVLYQFSGAPDGAAPNASLVVDGAGNLYGTTASGGDLSCNSFGPPEGCGTVFKLDKNGTESVIHIFTDNPDGKNPYSGLLPSGKGTAYGMTEYGGTLYRGTVFKLDQAGKVSIIHNFLAGSDGEDPYLTDLIGDAKGNLYGTTSEGGTNPILCSCGVVFKLSPSGQETILHRFTQGPTDGTFPEAGLVRDPAGNLYGTTFFGGNVCRYSNADGGCGTIFRISPTGKETILYNFTGGAEGANPAGRLLLDSAGNLYGTTAYGGIGCDTYGFGCGAIFKLDTSGKITVLHTFSGAPDGANPFGGLITDPTGNAYGVTSAGGNSSCGDSPAPGCGTVYKVDRSGKLTILHTFDLSDGSSPNATLVHDAAGNLYGTTQNGGNPICTYGSPPTVGCGTVFKITP